MQENQKQKLMTLLELANNYPSPHNGQPIVVKQVANNTLELCFDTSRGLSATPISYLFSFVSIGVFVRHLELCAEALGHKATVTLDLPKQEDMATAGLLRCGEVAIAFDVTQPDESLKQTIVNRQTSRKKYSAGLSDSEQQDAVAIAQSYGLAAHFVTPPQAQQVIWLNQRAVFDDFFDPKVRSELNHWFRYTAEEKHAKQDGLAYDCMELNGASMKAAVKHYKLLHWPLIAPLLKRYYLRTMRDNSSIGYVTAPFVTEQQSYIIGRCIMDMWIELAKAGHYLHPFGTIVSNDKAHADFNTLVGHDNETRQESYVVFIFRAGVSERPVESERMPIEKHLYNEGQA